MTLGAEFWGGPHDGEVMAIPEDLPCIVLPVMCAPSRAPDLEYPVSRLRTIRYRRTHNVDRRSGARAYVYEGEQ